MKRGIENRERPFNIEAVVSQASELSEVPTERPYRHFKDDESVDHAIRISAHVILPMDKIIPVK